MPSAGQRPALKRPVSYSKGLSTLAGTGNETVELHHTKVNSAALDDFLALSRSDQARTYQALVTASERLNNVAPLVARLAAAFGQSTHVPKAGPSRRPASFIAPLASATPDGGGEARRPMSALLAATRRRSANLSEMALTPRTKDDLAAMPASAASATIENMREMLQREAQIRNAGMATLRAIPHTASTRAVRLLCARARATHRFLARAAARRSTLARHQRDA